MLALVVIGVLLVLRADAAVEGEAVISVYRLGDWPAMFGIVLASVWKDMDFYGLIFLGGLKNINPIYYEAAHLDGAGVANLAEVLQPQGRLSPVTVSRLEMQPLFESLAAE